MSTRSLTVLQDSWEEHEEIAVMYRQMDGYPEGHGKDLADFLKGMRITNGMSVSTDKTANGGDCLAAQIVAHFKTEVGSIYLKAAGTRDCDEEYIYTVTPDVGAGTIRLKCEAVGYNGEPNEIIFDGLVDSWTIQ